MKNIPKKIYLQVGNLEDLDVSFKELQGITWSVERIDSTDIEYILNGDTEKREKKSFCSFHIDAIEYCDKYGGCTSCSFQPIK